MIDVKIDLRQHEATWELIACRVELCNQHQPILEVPPRIGETFKTKEAALATVKERVTIELQHHNRHEAGDDVRWHIKIHQTDSSAS